MIPTMILAVALQSGAPPVVMSATPATQAVNSPTDAERVSKSMELSALLNSEALVRQVTNRMLNVSLRQSLQASAEFQEMERRWPGITDEFIATMTPILIKSVVAHVPQFQQDAAAIYRDKLTLDDIVALLAFYRSPTGTRLLASVSANADLGPLVRQQLATEGKVPVAADDLKKMVLDSGSRSIGAMSLEDRFELMRFSETPAAAKLNQVNQAVGELSVRWANTSDPVAENEVKTAVTELIRRRAASDPAAKSNPTKSK